jgi:hypothetical protein
MSAKRNFSPDEYELLSAYLDDMLNEAERTALEARLASDDALRAELEALRNTVSLIQALPMLKAPRNFVLTPEMVKSRTEPGRVIRFPISTVMSAAASFVLIIIGLLLLTSGQIFPTSTTPAIDRGVENVDVAMQSQQAEMMPANAQIIIEQTTEPEMDDMAVISQRGMPTKTVTSATVGMIPMPTPTVSVMMTQAVMQPPSQPQAPASMAMNITPTPTESVFLESVPAVAFAPTENITMPTMDMADTVPDVMTDMTSMSMVTSPETTPMTGVIEIMGNAIPPSELPETLRDEVVVTITPTPNLTVSAPVSDSPSSITITTWIGIIFIIIGMLVLTLTIWRWRKG